ncbi:hypothetical protein [Streptomyces sp. NPDC059709]
MVANGCVGPVSERVFLVDGHVHGDLATPTATTIATHLTELETPRP